MTKEKIKKRRKDDKERKIYIIGYQQKNKVTTNRNEKEEPVKNMINKKTIIITVKIIGKIE